MWRQTKSNLFTEKTFAEYRYLFSGLDQVHPTYYLLFDLIWRLQNESDKSNACQRIWQFTSILSTSFVKPQHKTRQSASH